MEQVFVASILLILYAYVGYPLTLYLLSFIRHKPVAKGDFEPTVTLIVAACNEAQRIGPKLENTIALDYPREKLQILVASDGSTDATCDIVKQYEEAGIHLLAFPERKGKEMVQKEALRHSTGEVIVFSDVATILEPSGITQIVANFADASVGCVSSVDRIIGRDGKPCGESLYVRYEMWLRALESRVCSLVGLSGSFFAARKQVCRDFSGEVQSDFRTVLASVKMGYRGVCDSEAVGYYQDVADTRKEFDRKVRTVLRGLTVLFSNLEYLNVFNYGLFSFQYFCHKLLRWLVPAFLVSALLTNLLLSLHSVTYLFLLLVQLLFYVAAVSCWMAAVPPAHIYLKVPLYFVTVNTAILLAWWQFLGGKRMVMWSPSQR